MPRRRDEPVTNENNDKAPRKSYGHQDTQASARHAHNIVRVRLQVQLPDVRRVAPIPTLVEGRGVVSVLRGRRPSPGRVMSYDQKVLEAFKAVCDRDPEGSASPADVVKEMQARGTLSSMDTVIDIADIMRRLLGKPSVPATR